MVCDVCVRAAITLDGRAYRALLERGCQGISQRGLVAKNLFGKIADQHRAHVQVATGASRVPASLAAGVIVGHQERDRSERVVALQISDGATDPLVRRSAGPKALDRTYWVVCLSGCGSFCDR